MNKAFTKEPEADLDADEEDDRPEPAPVKGGNHITREGFLALKRELDRLWSVERPKVTEEVAVAAAQGDRSENAEYIYGKKKLREIDRRVRFLTKRIEAVTVVTPHKDQLGKVFFGAWFTIADEDDIESTYRIVGTDEVDLAKKKISVRSPLAQALLGKAEGDTATVLRPKGAAEVTVVRVWYEDE
ncbi:MAG: transcription elongation factor GreB [Myxococcales bacterium]|nr:transcription elongation factor GreB [Myxococcales bacterium]